MTQLQLRNAWAIFIAITCMLAFAASAHSSQKIKGKVSSAYENGSFCKVVGDLTKKQDVCPKDKDKQVASIVVVQAEESSITPDKGQKVIIKIKGMGKTTGKVVMLIDDKTSLEDVEKIGDNGSVILWKCGDNGNVMVIETKEVLKPEKDNDVKMILKKKAPKVEGC